MFDGLHPWMGKCCSYDTSAEYIKCYICAGIAGLLCKYSRVSLDPDSLYQSELNMYMPIQITIAKAKNMYSWQNIFFGTCNWFQENGLWAKLLFFHLYYFNFILTQE